MARPAGVESRRSLQLWNQNITYQLTVQENPGVKYDGKAFHRDVNGRKVPSVILNTAFFKKEAEALFERFSSRTSSKNVKGDEEISDPLLMKTGLVAVLLNLESLPPLAKDNKRSLRILQSTLEERAWREVFRRATEEASSREVARRRFVQVFTQIRLHAIERHEASHLLDMARAKDLNDPEFEKLTELNAFFTELAYGENPHDVMAQAIAGLLEEWERGEVVDYSALKVASILKFLETCPRKNHSVSGPLPTACLKLLLEVQKSDFLLAGKELYRPQATTTVALAPLP